MRNSLANRMIITYFCHQKIYHSILPLSKKLKLALNYIVGPTLFLVIGFSIYRQVISQPQLSSHWEHVQYLLSHANKNYLILTCFLMFVNWGIESKKWHILASHLQELSFWSAVKSVMAGVSFTMLTPNRMGEFLGRVIYLPDGSRIRAATLTMLSSISQLVITLICGVIGLFFLKIWAPQLNLETDGWTGLLVSALIYGTSALILIALLVYFNIGWLIRQVEKYQPFAKYAFYVQLIGEIHYKELIKLIALSVLRYVVFLIQYVLVFHFFEIGIPVEKMVASTSVMFLLLAIVPTIALAELGVRGKVSLFVFGLFSTNTLEILIATAVIWLINIIFPAIAGSFMLLSVKLYKK